MKTSIKTLFAAVLTLVVLTSSAFASSDVKSNNFTVLNQVKNITKLEVKGNVDVILVQASSESVKVNDSYYSKNALVQEKDGVLRISSFEKEPLSVTVYVRNLTAIEAGDNATVKTFGKVSFLTLDVVLKDKATADINAKTISLNTSVTDNASLKLSGSTEEHYALMGTSAKMSTGQFIAGTSDIKSIAPKYVAQAKVVAPTLESIAATELAK